MLPKAQLLTFSQEPAQFVTVFLALSPHFLAETS